MSCLLHILLYTHTKYKEESLAHTRTVFESFISSGPYPLSEEKRREEKRIELDSNTPHAVSEQPSSLENQSSLVQYSIVQYSTMRHSTV